MVVSREDLEEAFLSAAVRVSQSNYPGLVAEEEGRRLQGVGREAQGYACGRCHGEGSRTYGSTSTWRGGMGGASISRDICDLCWGTGRSDKTGYNLRKYEETFSIAVQKAASEYLVKRLYADRSSPVSQRARDHLLIISDKLSRCRFKEADFWLERTRDQLVDLLRTLGSVKPAVVGEDTDE